jgi:hypothetical protein
VCRQRCWRRLDRSSWTKFKQKCPHIGLAEARLCSGLGTQTAIRKCLYRCLWSHFWACRGTERSFLVIRSFRWVNGEFIARHQKNQECKPIWSVVCSDDVVWIKIAAILVWAAGIIAVYRVFFLFSFASLVCGQLSIASAPFTISSRALRRWQMRCD